MHASGEEVTNSNTRLVQAMCNTTDAVLSVIDDAGSVVAFNDEAERVFQRPANDVIGAPASRLFPEGSNAPFQVAAWGQVLGKYQSVVRRGDSAGAGARIDRLF